MTSIAIDGQNEEEFRRGIETDLRHGRERAASDRLRRLLEPYAAPGGILPERFLTVTANDLALKGWEYLGDCIARHDRAGRPVTAIGISFAWPGEDMPVPDADGRLAPHVETAYYNDAAYPFSQSGRDDLLDGYSLHGCTWAADCEASDNALSVEGIEDLHGALAQLETQLLGSEEPDEEAIRAGSLGACLLSVLLFQAVAKRVETDGLPRPLCVTAGSNGIYPYFDAPVVGMPESARRAAEKAEEEELDKGIPGPRYSSLLMTGIPRAQKRAVLVLAETESEMAVRIAGLRGQPADVPADEPSTPAPVIEPVRASAATASPLLTKKPSQHNWDFRDLLGPLPPENAPHSAHESGSPMSDDDQHDGAPEDPVEPWFDAAWEEAEPAPTPSDFAGDDEAGDVPQPAKEQRFALKAVPASPRLFEDEPGDVHPGFPMLSESLQDRLESLLAPHVPVAPVEPAIADEAQEPEPLELESGWATEPLPPSRVEADPWPIEAAGLAWPFGPETAPMPVEALAAMRLDDAAAVDELPRGLFARLAAWIRRKG